MILIRHYAVLWRLLSVRDKIRRIGAALLLAGVCFVLTHGEEDLIAHLNAWIVSFDPGAAGVVCWLIHGLILFLNSHDFIAQHPAEGRRDQLIFYRRAGFTTGAYLLLEISRFLPTAVCLFFLHRFLFRWFPLFGGVIDMSLSIVFALFPVVYWLLRALPPLAARRTPKNSWNVSHGTWLFSNRAAAQLTYYLRNPFLLLLALLSAISLYFIVRVTKNSLIGILFSGWLSCPFVLFAHRWNERHAFFLELLRPSRASLRRTYVFLALSLLAVSDGLVLVLLLVSGTIPFLPFLLTLLLHFMHLFLLSWTAATLALAYFPERSIEMQFVPLALFVAPSIIPFFIPIYFMLFNLLLRRKFKEPMDWSACPDA